MVLLLEYLVLRQKIEATTSTLVSGVHTDRPGLSIYGNMSTTTIQHFDPELRLSDTHALFPIRIPNGRR